MALTRFSELRNSDTLNPPVSLRSARIVATSGTGTGAVNFNIPADELLLTQDRYDAIDNAVGGKLEDVTTITQEGTHATGWLRSAAWSLYGDGVLFRINGHDFIAQNGQDAYQIAARINSEPFLYLVDASVAPDDRTKIDLKAKVIGDSGNDIALATVVSSVYASGASLEGGQDEVLASSVLAVGSAGVTVTGAAGSTMEVGMPVNMPGYSLTAGSITSDGKTVLRDGVAPAKSILSSGSSDQLVHGRVYTLTVAEDTDLSVLTVADDATAEIWVTYSAGVVTWPGAWVWGTDVFDSASSEAEPVFAAGEMYCVVVRRYAARGVTIATLSHTVK